MEQESAQRAGVDAHLGHDTSLYHGIDTTYFCYCLQPVKTADSLTFAHYMHIYLRCTDVSSYQ